MAGMEGNPPGESANPQRPQNAEGYRANEAGGVGGVVGTPNFSIVGWRVERKGNEYDYILESSRAHEETREFVDAFFQPLVYPALPPQLQQQFLIGKTSALPPQPKAYQIDAVPPWLQELLTYRCRRPTADVFRSGGNAGLGSKQVTGQAGGVDESTSKFTDANDTNDVDNVKGSHNINAGSEARGGDLFYLLNPQLKPSSQRLTSGDATEAGGAGPGAGPESSSKCPGKDDIDSAKCLNAGSLQFGGSLKKVKAAHDVLAFVLLRIVRYIELNGAINAKLRLSRASPRNDLKDLMASASTLAENAFVALPPFFARLTAHDLRLYDEQREKWQYHSNTEGRHDPSTHSDDRQPPHDSPTPHGVPTHTTHTSHTSHTPHQPTSGGGGQGDAQNPSGEKSLGEKSSGEKSMSALEIGLGSRPEGDSPARHFEDRHFEGRDSRRLHALKGDEGGFRGAQEGKGHLGHHDDHLDHHAEGDNLVEDPSAGQNDRSLGGDIGGGLEGGGNGHDQGGGMGMDGFMGGEGHNHNQNQGLIGGEGPSGFGCPTPGSNTGLGDGLCSPMELAHMSGMAGMSGMSGMNGMVGMSGMNGMGGMSGMGGTFYNSAPVIEDPGYYGEMDVHAPTAPPHPMMGFPNPLNPSGDMGGGMPPGAGGFGLGGAFGMGSAFGAGFAPFTPVGPGSPFGPGGLGVGVGGRNGEGGGGGNEGMGSNGGGVPSGVFRLPLGGAPFGPGGFQGRSVSGSRKSGYECVLDLYAGGMKKMPSVGDHVLTPPAQGWYAKYSSGVTGVVWDRVHQAWVVSWTLAGKRTFRHFTCKSYGGFDKAREAAIEFRLARNREIAAYNKR